MDNPESSRLEPNFDLFVETLHQLEPGPRGLFIQKFMKNLIDIDITESESVMYWERLLQRRLELAERLGRPVSLRTAAVDYFDTTPLLRNPVLVDYAELKRLRFNAATDPLTGLYNRRLFDEYFRRELTRSSRHAYPLAPVLFDLSNFRQVNDTYGHAVGDSVLLTLARISAETIRGSDYPFRIGGDEFAVLLPQSDSQSAQTLIRRIVQKFQDQVRELVPDLELRLDYGVALFPDDGESAANLFQAADRRLYAGKRSPVERESVLAAAEVPSVGATPGTEPSPSKHARLPGTGLQLRRYKRISLKGTGAYAVVSNGFGSKATQLIDLSFGGMGILLEEVVDLPETFLARLYLPIQVDLPRLPDQELTVRRVYAQPLPDGFFRVGCSFTF